MYLHLTTILALNVCSGFCFVAYDIFKGFGNNDSPDLFNTEADNFNSDEIEQNNIAETDYEIMTDGTSSKQTNKTTDNPSATTPNMDPKSPGVILSKMKCPEEEVPRNIGPYEVPSQKDLVLLIRKTLSNAFNSYHMKALYFLKDIRQATSATKQIEDRCHRTESNRKAYKNCVKHVSNKCEIITKSLVTSLENQRQKVSNFTEETICNIKLMKADPVQLIKLIAMEEASLEFALPGFLRLLNSCALHCETIKYDGENDVLVRKPIRHMSDQSLVIKHLLTNKNYLQLLQGS